MDSGCPAVPRTTLFIPLRLGLSLNLELGILVWLVDQQALRICIPQHWGHRQAKESYVAFYEVVRNSNTCLQMWISISLTHRTILPAPI